MMHERFIVLANHEAEERTKYKDLEALTGIKRSTLKALYEGRQRFNEEHITAISEAFPQYKMWFVFGEVYPELGQISPEVEETRKAYNG